MAGALKGKHTRRFGLAYLGLAALLGAAVGTFILLVDKPAPLPPPPWSAWRPTSDTALGRATEIAEHVARDYKLASGKQLVRVYVGNPDSVQEPIRALAVAKTSQASSPDDFQIFDASKAVMYILCGNGERCAIKEGKPSVARGDLLRREALELALYTFSYVEGVENVVAFFPPRKGQNPTYALFFRKGDFEDHLDRPLRRTLPGNGPAVPGTLTAGERKVIQDLTASRVFRYAVEDANGGQRVLVLAPEVG